jgi:hypothetical protein
MRDSFLKGSPFGKEVEDLASKRYAGDSKPPGEIMKEDAAISPISEKAPRSSQFSRPQAGQGQ